MNMSIEKKILQNVSEIVKDDKKNIFFLLYYSAIEAVLILAIPLASAFIINSILAHSSISMTVLGFIVLTIFVMTTILAIIKEYITEKFQQKIFVSTAIKISKLAIKFKDDRSELKTSMDKLMNYFFDVTSVQKVFPVLILDGTGLVIKVIVSLLLLLAFNTYLFAFGLFFFIAFTIIIIFLGKNGVNRAIERSDSKHKSIYYLQHIPFQEQSNEKILTEFDGYLNKYIETRTNMFGVIIRQFGFTFIVEGIVFSTFLILGGYLVINGTLPIGEFVAAEIIVVSITYALKGFIKQIDYMYDIIEGLYKIDKLTSSLSAK
ncbi:MAG: ABC transporter ATP-binding protein [Campylobacterota bacterium]|nr:ABC transporter ATP-binding protein [Campylobacterota bacterium]